MQDTFEFFEYLLREGSLLFLVVVLSFYLMLETFLPLRINSGPLVPRWTTNILLHVVNSIVAYFLLFNFFGVDLDVAATRVDIGIFNWLTGTPLFIQFLVFIVLADFSFYWFHRAMHTWRPLWRVHIVHHSDRDVDITDSFRGHPFQIILEAAMRIGLVLLLGVPIAVLILYDVFYSIFVFYPHAKVKIPRRIEQVLRTVVVTSDLHRSHHSANPVETNSNYGDIFSFWDRMFGTYRFLEWDEQEKMTLGLEYFRSDSDQSLLKVLAQPFTYKPNKAQPAPVELKTANPTDSP